MVSLFRLILYDVIVPAKPQKHFSFYAWIQHCHIKMLSFNTKCKLNFTNNYDTGWMQRLTNWIKSLEAESAEKWIKILLSWHFTFYHQCLFTCFCMHRNDRMKCSEWTFLSFKDCTLKTRGMLLVEREGPRALATPINATMDLSRNESPALTIL